MAESRAARPSTDEETAPLLRDHENGNGNGGPPNGGTDSLGHRITAVVQEPLTALTKILLVVTLLLLLLTSVFIGLFAGAQHKLHLPGTPSGHVTYTQTQTQTQTHTQTQTQTQTATQTATQTQTATTTDIQTTTDIRTTTDAQTTTLAPVPIPVPTNKPPVDGACLSSDCVILSASILSSLDTTQDPCENFYDFATGGWSKSHPIPADKGRLGTFNVLAQANQQAIRQILESTDIPDSDSYSDSELAARSYDAQILQKVRGLYHSCVDEDTLEAVGAAPLQDFVGIMKRLFRGESTEVGAAAARDKYEGLTAAVAFLHSRGVGALFAATIEGDVGTDPDAMVLWFSQPELGLPAKEYYKDKDIVKTYTDVVEQLLDALADDDEEFFLPESTPGGLVQQDSSDNAWPPYPWPPWDGDDGGDQGPKPKPGPRRPAPADVQARKVVAFEKKIADASLDMEDLYYKPFERYNPMALDKFSRTIPEIHFAEYFAAFTPRAFPERVVVTYPAYYKSLARILEETPAEVVEAYLVARAALTLAAHLSPATPAWRAQRRLEETLNGIKRGAVGERWETCVHVVEEQLGFAVGRYFVNETFAGDSQAKGTKVITNIVATFKESLKNLEWMDEKSAAAATKKADNIKVKVGFPLSPDTRDARSIANYYSKVDIKKDYYFENFVSASVNAASIEWMKLGRRRNPESWEMYPSMVNAYFSPDGNQIVFPAGILQPPFFSQDWPSYLSYGAFGMVAAHELTHAFDSLGRLYNQDAKLERWWTNATSDAFMERQKCIVDQYSKYTVEGPNGEKVHVNGNLTSSENIGDSGVIQAYRAWKAQLHASYRDGGEFLLPGLNYTREQMFFIGFARAWANNARPESAVQLIRVDPHSPTRWRVDGTLSNVPEFAEAFQCKKGAKLNPPDKERCIFW